MKRILLAVGVLAALSLASAQPFVWPSEWTVAEPGDAEYGGTYRSYQLDELRTFNPFVSAEANNAIVDMAEWQGLFDLDPATMAYIPYAVSDYEVSEDGTVFTMQIREGMLWSDGEPITAQDFYTSYLIHTDEDVGSNSYDSFFVGGELVQVEMLDEMSLRATFPSVDRGALNTLAILTPAPDHVFGERYREGGAEAVTSMWGTETDPSELVVAGPFQPVQYTPGERMVFERNERFGEWNVDEEGNPLPYLDRYQEAIVESTDAALNLYVAGEIDSYAPGTLDEVGVVSQAINNGDIDATLLPNHSPTASSNFIVFNWNKASEPEKQRLFRSSTFRRAMSHLVDREAMVDLVYGGAAEPMWTNVYRLFSDWVSPDAARFPYDPERAAELLAELGYSQRNDDGVLVNRDGDELSFRMVTNAGNSEREQILQIFADEARAIGVEVDAQPLDFSLLVDQLLATGDDRPFDAILIGLSGGDPNYPLGASIITCTGNLHAWNLSGQCLTPNETLAEELFYQGQRTLDTEEAQAIAHRIQNVLAEIQPLVFTVSPLAHFSWLNELGGEYPDDIINAYVGTRSVVLTYKR